jgi:GPH family glycoside/pentoside/hexuronide:cation symporter
LPALRITSCAHRDLITIRLPGTSRRCTVLAAYGSLAFPLAGAFIALQVIVPTYYAQALGLSLSAVGAILLAARLWDLFTDPIVGYLSDRTPRTPGASQGLGRRQRPAGRRLGVGAVQSAGRSVGNRFLLLCTLGIYVAGTMSIVPMNAWGAEISDAYHQRSRIPGPGRLRPRRNAGALLLVDNSSDAALGRVAACDRPAHPRRPRRQRPRSPRGWCRTGAGYVPKAIPCARP